ncbi:MAG: hypothetical protein AB7W59_03320 [Acidimicrobiia bacterium]
MAKKKTEDHDPDDRDGADDVQRSDENGWRRPSVKRPHYRNPITYVDRVAGARLKALREAKNLTQPEVADGMLLPDGSPHPSTAVWRARQLTDVTAKDQKTTTDMIAKSVSKHEAAELALLLSTFLALCNGLDEDPGSVLRMMGFAKGAMSIEAAITGAEDLTPEAKRALIDSYRAMRRP